MLLSWPSLASGPSGGSFLAARAWLPEPREHLKRRGLIRFSQRSVTWWKTSQNWCNKKRNFSTGYIFSREISALISVLNQEKLVCNIVPLSNVWKPTFARSSGVLRYCYNKKKHLLQIFIATSSIWSQMRIFMTFFTAWIAYTLFRSSSALQHKT